LMEENIHLLWAYQRSFRFLQRISDLSFATRLSMSAAYDALFRHLGVRDLTSRPRQQPIENLGPSALDSPGAAGRNQSKQRAVPPRASESERRRRRACQGRAPAMAFRW
jgi:hypothetical protein